MSDLVKRINLYFKYAVKSDIDKIKANVVFSERQKKVFEMFYIQKHDISFIADKLNSSYSVIKSEIQSVREKIYQVI